MNSQTFADLKLSPEVLRAITRAGYERPTPIQAMAIPPALLGRDLIGLAATGTGKTAAFLLPVIERIAGKKGTRVLVLAPTRELALQIGEELERFGRSRSVRGTVVIGGVGMGNQTQAMRSGVEVIIATPGRLVDHLQHGTARLDQIEILILDEADRMLDMGFKPQLDKILARVPKQRQTMLFSATVGDEVGDFARKCLRDPVRVEIARSGTTASRAEQQVFLASQQEKVPLLLALLERDDATTLVFTRTKRRADRVAKDVGRAGHKVARIHADRSQAQRRMALDGFKDGTYRVLVATDIAARGIDVADIGHVVNFDLPHVPEDYVHRIGRTARAEASGRASSFTSPEERDLLTAIERFTRTPIPRAQLPREEATFKAELELSATRAAQNPPKSSRARRPSHSQRGKPSSSASAKSRPATKKGHGHATASSGQPRSVGSWGPKRRR
jgi:ATP-dependent RNA helicase RhlE